MPTYRYHCDTCGLFELWQSMKDKALTTHDCGSEVRRVYTKLTTIGVGVHGAKTQEVEAREARWQRDMPAYKRFRDNGYFPPQIDGCDHLEATAQNALWVNSGGKVRVDEQKMVEAKGLAEDIAAGRA